MSSLCLRQLLGASPSTQGFLYWTGCFIICIGCWHCYKLSPIGGIIFIGIAPIMNFFLFFRGMSCMVRAILHFKTYQCAQKLNITPSWGHAQGGFIVIDTQKQLWIVNGVSGSFSEITSITVKTYIQAYYLQINRNNKKTLSIGMQSKKEAEHAATHLQKILYITTTQKIPIALGA